MHVTHPRKFAFMHCAAWFFAGAAILCFLATLQKMGVGAPLSLKGYVVPFIFGGTSAFFCAFLRSKLKRTIVRLEELNRYRDLRLRIDDIFLTIPDDEVYGRILEVVLEASESRFGVFGYIDDNGALVCPSMTRNIWETCQIPDKSFVFQRDAWGGVWGRALLEKRSFLVNETCHVPEGHIPIEKAAAVPIMYRGNPIGLIVVGNKKENYENEDLKPLESIAADIAPILYARQERDTHHRRQLAAEQRLKRSEAFFRTVVDHSHSGFFILDGNHRILYANKKLSEISGYASDEIIGEDYRRFIAEESRETVDDRYVRRRKGEDVESRYEFAFIRKDGDKRDVELSVTVVMDPENGDLTVGQVVDVTDAKREQESLHTRGRQQTLEAELGQMAMTEKLPELLARAAEYVARGLQVEYSEILEWLPPEDAFVLRAGVGWKKGWVGAIKIPSEGSSQAGYTLIADGPVYVEDMRTEKRFRPCLLLGEHQAVAGLSIVIPSTDRAFGVLGVHTASERRFTNEDCIFLQTVAHILASAVMHKEDDDQLRAARARLSEVEETERRRLARELHDQIGPNLTALNLNLNILRNIDAANADRRSRLIGDALDLVGQISDIIQDVMSDLRPGILDDYGLIAALRWYSKTLQARSRIGFVVEGDESIRLSQAVETAMFRVAQEALNNVIKHAGANVVAIRLVEKNGAVSLSVTDDGVGFEPARAVGKGWGLLTMRERIEALGAAFQITSSPGRGASVRIEMQR